MQTQWIKEAASNYGNHLRDLQIAENNRRRKEEVERERRDRIAEEGPGEGVKLWTALQVVVKNDVAEFNGACGFTVLRPKALGDGSLEVHFGEPGSNAEKVFALSYDPKTTVMLPQLFGGEKFTPFTVSLDESGNFAFTNGTSFPGLETISKMVITHLLP
jgi:hypothetical protein